MKLKQTCSLLAVWASSQLSSVIVHAKKNSIKGDHDRSSKNDPNYSRAQANLYERPSPPEETTASSPVVVVVPSASSSSLLLRRDLKKGSSDYFFFEECSDTCAANDGVATSRNDNCCDGGVSFLKVKFHAQEQISGTITLGSAHSPSCGNSQDDVNSRNDRGHKRAKAGSLPNAPSPSSSSSDYEHRLVDCNAACIQNPFDGVACEEDSVLNEKEVEVGSEICIAMIKSETNQVHEIAFDEKMPTDLYVLFLSSEGFSVGAIHTSCSVPLSQSWGVRLEDPCNDAASGNGRKKHARERHINVSDIAGDSTPYLSFIDGISTKYFSAVEQVIREPDTQSYVQDFSIGFKNCGCTCESFTPSLTPSAGANPSSIPSKGPTSAPIFAPSPAPFEATTSSPTKRPTSGPIFAPSPAPFEATTISPTTEPFSMPTNPSSNPSSAPTDATTSATTSVSTPTDTTIVNPGPRSPSGSTCDSTCAAYILEQCVFVGTNDACDINAEVPVVADDDQVEGTVVGTLPNDTEKSGKGTKGKKGFGKSGSGKVGKKEGKGASFGQATEGEYGHKKTGEKMNHSDSKLAKQSKGKGVKGRESFSNNGYERHLQQIEYHQSRIDYFKKLLMHTEE